MQITNLSEQERVITVHLKAGPVELAMGRPGARSAWDARPSADQVGEAPPPVMIDVEQIAKAAKVKPDDLIAAVKADQTYQTWLAEGVFAEA